MSDLRGPVKVTEQDRRQAADALARALHERRSDVEVLAEVIAFVREEGWRSCLDRIVDPGLRAALRRGHE